MFGTLTLALAVTVADPRPDLVELQLAGKSREALARVEQEMERRPEPSRDLGLGYLLGHLLERAGRIDEAAAAFAQTMADTPALRLYSRYRLALDQDRMGHPEVAAGLIAEVAAQGDPRSPLIPDAVRLFSHTLAEGGDCQLLHGVRPEAFPAPQRRELQLAMGECALRTGFPETARSLMVRLIEEGRGDEFARRAADHLCRLMAEAERGRLPMLLGFTFHQHREYDRALRLLQRTGKREDALSSRDVYEAQAVVGESLLSQQRYAEASVAFAALATLARTPGERARAYHQEARAHELRGAWPTAASRFRQAWQADPQSRDWASASLLSALRLEWRNGAEQRALTLYNQLTMRPEWRGEAARAALFMAVSDIARGRRDRARPWLERAYVSGRGDRLEADYWLGRLAELERNPGRAVSRYLEVLRAGPHHPLAQAAASRLAGEALAPTALAAGRRLAAADRLEDLYGAWLLLGAGEPAGRAVQRRLEQRLRADPSTAPYLRPAEVPVRRWLLWNRQLRRPEEMLLALGIWYEGAPAVPDHFPLADVNLAYTGGRLLARGAEWSRSIAVAEALRAHAPGRLPLALQSREYRRLLYPFPYREVILAQGKIRGVDPNLLAAVIREESRFDVSALSGATRGLTQLTLSTARRLAAELNLERLAPEHLFQPGVSIALGAGQLGALVKDFAGDSLPAVAAYDAGEPQALVWRSWCFTQEPDEYFTKIGDPQTREYVRRVMVGRAVYQGAY